MEIDAKRRYFDSEADVIPAGRHFFIDPIVNKCLKDSVSSSESGNWSLYVDAAEYARIVAENTGVEDVDAYVYDAYTSGLREVDSEIEDFELELFWQTYQQAKGVELDFEDED